jgi:catechol 2,3-dioxygenase-like lactoylglutathione lyase family enzyme
MVQPGTSGRFRRSLFTPEEWSNVSVERRFAVSVRLHGLDIDAGDPERLALFWAALLGREVASDAVTLTAASKIDFELRFTLNPEPKSGLNRMHFDLTSESAKDQQHTVARALELGASHLDVGQRGTEGHVVLADPEGNEFCVIEPGNAFLAHTARIGALAGDGTAEVGRFWSEALAWPLVWDQDEETAIQSPDGGSKITWGGPPVRPKRGRNRMRFELTCYGRFKEEVARLEGLGATTLVGSPAVSAVTLADPDGNEFSLRRTP